MEIVENILNKNKQTNIVEEFVKDGLTISNHQEIVENFNNYFVSIGEKLAESIPAASASFSSYLNNSNMDSFALFLTDATEVIEIVYNLKDKSSYGVDGIPVNIMKKCITQIAEPLSFIIKCSFRTGCIPNQLKIAKVCPIFKAGPENTFLNYRPI